MTTPVVGRSLTQVAFSEAKRNWPFVAGFGVTLSLVFTLATSLDREYCHALTFFSFFFGALIFEPRSRVAVRVLGYNFRKVAVRA